MTDLAITDVAADRSSADVPRRDRSHRAPPRTRLDEFPRDPALRWLLRLALTAPYLAVAIVGELGRVGTLVTPNQQLLVHLSTVSWDRADPEWVGQIYPPVTTLLAAVIPGGRLGLAIAGAVVAGVFLQKLAEIMVQRRFPVATIVILTLAVGANPLFAYTAVENLPAIVGLACFGLAASDLVRFVAWRNTRAGFRAGILLMVAMLSDLGGVLYVLTVAIATPFLHLGRKGQPGARWANVLVVVYPTLSALSAILLINWVFTGDPLLPWTRDLLAGGSEGWHGLVELLSGPSGLFLIAPVVSGWAVALIVRRPGSILVTSLVFVAVLGGRLLGLIPDSSAGTTFILMTVMAIAMIPTARERFTALLVDVVAVLQIAIAWGSAFTRQPIIDWMAALGTIPFGG